jgi:hypothetical protein
MHTVYRIWAYVWKISCRSTVCTPYYAHICMVLAYSIFPLSLPVCLPCSWQRVRHSLPSVVWHRKRKERKKKNYAGSKTLPASIKEKETHWPEVPWVSPGTLLQYANPPQINRVGQNRICDMYTVYDRIFGDFPAKNAVHTPYIYGSGQPYKSLHAFCVPMLPSRKLGPC